MPISPALRRLTTPAAAFLLAAAVVPVPTGDAAPPPPATPHATPADDVPEVAREFRGVWVASVANIDWPSKPGLSTHQQKLELMEILDRAAALRLNAVIFQVRPAADALYDSKYEPWS